VTRVEITNFESIEHAVVDIDGFTTVQGGNFHGKSAIMRAINAALTNRQSSGFISWGKTFCEVNIKSGDFDLLWHKEESNNYYLINGKKYTKIGRDEPPKEINAAGFGPVHVGDDRYNLYYSPQFSPLFLVDDQNTKTADLIASAYGLDRVHKASEFCSRDQRSVESLLKLRSKDLEQVETDLKKYEGFEKVAAEGQRLQKDASRIDSDASSIKQLDGVRVAMESLASECARMRPIISVEIPKGDQIRKALDEASTLCSMEEKLSEASSSEAKMKPINDIEIPDKDAIQAIQKDVFALHFLQVSAEQIVEGKQEIESLLSEQTTCEAELMKVQKERSSYEACPLCKRKF